MAEEVSKKRSPWVYVGLGCGLAVLLSCGSVFIAILAGASFVKGWSEEMADPAKRESKARREAMALIGGVPEGYSPAVSFGLPMMFDMVMFVDAPLLADGGVPLFERQFIFMTFMETERSNEMKKYFDSADGGVFETENLKLDSKGELGRGNFQHKGRKVSWVSMVGQVKTQGQFDTGQDSIVTTMLYDCPDNGTVRIGTWQMKEPEGGVADLSGTVADPVQMQKLLTPLTPCGK